MGLMIALEFDKPCTELVSLAMNQGLPINVTVENVVRLLPPLILKDEEADLLVQRLVTTIKSRG
jgi:acetylornithine aminotransferase